MTSVEKAQQAVAEAWGRVYRLAAGQPGVEPKGLDAALNNLVRAVEARCAERILATLPDKLPCNCYGCDECGKREAADLIHPDTQEQQ